MNNYNLKEIMKRRNFIASTLGLASVGAIQASPSPQTSPREFKLGDFTYQRIDDTRYVKTDKSGNKFYYQMDLLHREDGPAIEHSEVKIWYLNGKFVKATNLQLGTLSKISDQFILS